MPTKEKRYDRVIFTPEVIKGAVNVLVATLAGKERKQTWQSLTIKMSTQEKWSYNNEEEFFADYVKGFEYAWFSKLFIHGNAEIGLWVFEDHTEATVSMSTRSDVEKVFNYLEANVEKCYLPKPPPKKRQRPKIKVFIGHGQNPQWRDLKDHLHEKHKLDVEAYEIGVRAGLTVKEVLDDMLTSSSFAVLVLTGEDVDAAGGLHARENVIHELGLFQGRLGWRKAIALLEEGVVEFSNIHGLNQIRFQKDNIQATFGEVLATITREFPAKG